LYWAIWSRQTQISKGGSIWQTELSKGSIGQFGFSKLNCQKKDQGQTALSKGRIWQFDLSKFNCQKKNQFGKVNCQKDVLLGNVTLSNLIVKRIDLANSMFKMICWAIRFWQIESLSKGLIWQTVLLSKGRIWQFDSGKLNHCQKDWFQQTECSKGSIGQFDYGRFCKLYYCPKEGSLIWQLHSRKLNCHKDWFGKLYYCLKEGLAIWFWQTELSKGLVWQI